MSWVVAYTIAKKKASWTQVKSKLEEEGAKNKQYDSDIDGVIDNSDKVDGFDLDQDVSTSASPTFAGLTVNNATVNYDAFVKQLWTDTIVERTTDSGVTIDGCLIKDGVAEEADKVDGLDLPNTCANVLTDHDKATHDALGIDADTVDGKDAGDLQLKKYEGGAESSIDGSTVRVDIDNNKVSYWDGSSWTDIIGGGTGDVDTVDGKHASDFADTSLSNVSDSTILDKVKNVDGSGSGLDADTVDGLHASSFIRSDADDTFAGTLTWNKTGGVVLKMDSDVNYHKQIAINDGSGNFTIKSNWDGSNKYITSDHGAVRVKIDTDGCDGTFYVDVAPKGTAGNSISGKTFILKSDGTITWMGNKIWHAGNDGSGSGLDADLLDGKHASDFVQSPLAEDLDCNLKQLLDARIEIVTSLPTADSSRRGQIVVLDGGSGNPDKVYICLKNSSDSYEWVQIGVAT